MKRVFSVFSFFRLISILGLPGLFPPAFASSGPTTLTNPLPAAFNYYYGTTVALTPDGSLAVVGADSGGYGLDTPPAVYIFQYANGAWNTSPIITVSDPAAFVAPTDLFGSAVSASGISNNSFLLVVGSPGGGVVGGSPVNYGVVYLYRCTVSPAACGLPVAQLNDPAAGPSASDDFGSAVAVSQDGNTILAGAWGTPEPGGAGLTGNQHNEGVAYVYNNAGNNNWTLATPPFFDPAPTCASFGNPPSQICDKFGYAVALAGTGSNTLTALVGAPGAVVVNNGSPEPGEGQAFIFDNSSGSWQLTQTFTDPNSVACSDVAYLKCDEFGNAVALSTDGTVALVGAPNAVIPTSPVLGEAGVANLYVQSGGSWSNTPFTFTNPDTRMNTVYSGSDGFGWSLAVANANSNLTVTIGNPGATEGTNNGGYGGSGEVDEYSCSPACSSTPTSVLVDPPIAQNPTAFTTDNFGAAVALSQDADVLLAGAPGTASPAPNSAQNNGAAYVYGAPGPQVPPTPVQLTMNLGGPNNVKVNAGQNLTYTITVTNTSQSGSAVNLMLTGTLSAGVTLVSESADGASCSASGSSYSCALGSLGPGASWTPSVTVEIDSSDAGQAVVAASMGVMASNSSNNPSVTASVIVAQANSLLSIYYQPLFEGIISEQTPECNAIDNNGNCVQPGIATVCANDPGTSCFMAIVVSNTSSTQPVDNLSLVITVPQGVTVSSVSASPGLCVLVNVISNPTSSVTLSCGLGTLTNGPNGGWLIIFNESVDSTDQYGQAENSQVTATAANTPPATQSYDFTVGTSTTVAGSNSGLGALDWLEVAALGILLWFSQWRKKRMQG